MQSIDIQAQAQQLRNEGFSVRNIAEQLGKSKSWVDRNTQASMSQTVPVKESAPSTKRDIALTQALAKATSPQGCNTSEFNSIIKSVFGVIRDEDTGSYVVDCSSEEKKAIKRSVKDIAAREGKTALFFEDFISREIPEHSLQLMLTLAQGVHEAVELAVAEFREVYPEASVYSVQQALKGMAVQGYRPESVEAYCERAAKAAHALQQVAPTVEAVETVTEHTDEFLADLADIDAELFGNAEAPVSTLPVATHDEYREDVPAPEVEEGDDFGLSLDDLEDDESLIDYDAVDDQWSPAEYSDDMAIDERYERNEETAQAIRQHFAGRNWNTDRPKANKRPSDWAIKQAEEDEFYAILADAESHNENFVF